jgi:hypothetical protein
MIDMLMLTDTITRRASEKIDILMQTSTIMEIVSGMIDTLVQTDMAMRKVSEMIDTLVQTGSIMRKVSEMIDMLVQTGTITRKVSEMIDMLMQTGTIMEKISEMIDMLVQIDTIMRKVFEMIGIHEQTETMKRNISRMMDTIARTDTMTTTTCNGRRAIQSGWQDLINASRRRHLRTAIAETNGKIQHRRNTIESNGKALKRETMTMMTTSMIIGRTRRMNKTIGEIGRMSKQRRLAVDLLGRRRTSPQSRRPKSIGKILKHATLVQSSATSQEENSVSSNARRLRKLMVQRLTYQRTSLVISRMMIQSPFALR